ncbi:hypothetical protein HPB47_018829 [Ixodes persulcatus]|uniref:Uncharacterized protein n=1 Tax=Ixodes persulcatus TaxID=34615 RepID=A0AC60QND3_IXOPE|nr:hypothetical protein HPB47_018829 [Ixodes persulcatus]
MEVVNEPGTGTSTVRDTTPDLTLVRENLKVTCRNTGENLGSDHDIICVTLGGTDIKAKLGQANITDLDWLRRSADSEGEDEDQDTKTYEAWAKKQREFVMKFTQKITTTTQVPFVDSRISHMWAARHGLIRRWKRQRHNNKLRRRIHALNKQAAEYAEQLYRENWIQMCEDLQGTPSTKRT